MVIMALGLTGKANTSLRFLIMKKLLSALLSTLMVMVFQSGSAQQTTYTKVYYDMTGSAQVYATIATPGQNFLIAGERNDEPLVMKIDSSGSILWQKRLALPYSQLYCAIATRDSGFLLAGKISNPAPAFEDFLCMKLSQAGDTLWTRAIDLGIEDRAFGITESAAHEVVITGYSTPDGASASSIAVVKLDSSGNFLWGRTFYGGNSANVGRGICQVPDGGFVVTGSIAGASPYNEGLILMKLTPDGDLSWIKKQANLVGIYSQGFDIKPLPGGLIVYWTSTDAGVSLMKTDLSGNVLWSKGYTWSNTVYYGTPGPKLGQTSQGGYLFVQYFDMFGTGGAAKTDSSGNLLWSDFVVVISNSAMETSDGGCLISGNGPIYGVSMSPSDRPQIGIIKTDSAGNSTDCAFLGGFWESPYTISWLTPSITSTVKGTATKIHPAIISLIDLDTISGCVTVFGSATENQPQSSSLLIFPNPSDGKFSLEFTTPVSSGTMLLEVFDCRGKQVYRSALPAINPLPVTLSSLPGINVVPVTLSSLPPGIYLIRVIAGDEVYTKKLIICRF